MEVPLPALTIYFVFARPKSFSRTAVFAQGLLIDKRFRVSNPSSQGITRQVRGLRVIELNCESRGFASSCLRHGDENKEDIEDYQPEGLWKYLSWRLLRGRLIANHIPSQGRQMAV